MDPANKVMETDQSQNRATFSAQGIPMTHKRSSLTFSWLASLLLLPTLALAADNPAIQRLIDKAEMEYLLMQYTYAFDQLDADRYVAVFTDDAEFDLGGGQVLKGKDAIRTLITSRQEAPQSPDVLMHHIVTNSSFEFVSDSEARHYGYWITMVGDMQKGFTVPAMGHYEDVLVKENERWLFKARKLVLPGGAAGQ
jgi:ketosteroid isomerase-like protein